MKNYLCSVNEFSLMKLPFTNGNMFMSKIIIVIKKIPQYIKQKIFSVLYKIQLFRRKFVTNKQRRSLINKNFTLISNNCNGCVLLHELGLKFNSQFVNLFINSNDYIKYLKDFDYYNNMELSFDDDNDVSYPVGKLGDIRIDFVHYHSNDEAALKWNDRKKRINKENMFVIFTEQDGCTKECLDGFDELPFENKIVFTCNKYDDVKSSVFVKKYFGNTNGVVMFLSFKNKFSKKRNYDVFDFVSWFNGEKNLSKLMKE